MSTYSSIELPDDHPMDVAVEVIRNEPAEMVRVSPIQGESAYLSIEQAEQLSVALTDAIAEAKRRVAAFG